MQIEDLIKHLGEVIKIDLHLSEQGICSVLFDEDEVIFEKYGDQLYLIAEIGTVQHSNMVLKRIITANYLGQETGQGVISVKDDSNSFVLHRIIDGELSYTEFEKILTVFLKAVRYWKEWLAMPQPETTKHDKAGKDSLLWLA